MQTPQLSLFCVVSMEMDVTWLFFPPLFEGWKCLILCSSSFYSFAKQLFGPKCALSSWCRPTHTSLPLLNHCIHSCSSSQPCVSERKQSQISCAGAAAATVPHTRAFSTRREAWSISLWTSLTAAAFAPFVLPLMCIWLENCSGQAWLHIFVALVSSKKKKKGLNLRRVYLNCIYNSIHMNYAVLMWCIFVIFWKHSTKIMPYFIINYLHNYLISIKYSYLFQIESNWIYWW